MLISYNWLQEYFKETLPSPDKLRDLFTFHFCEVEDTRQFKNSLGESDTVFDLKVLPDRAHYALSYWGIAHEVEAETGLQTHFPPLQKINADDISLPIKIESDFCNRYTARIIRNVSVGESSPTIKAKLEAMGQRPVNSIVDLLNTVMFETGQPLHAFDADHVQGHIVIRQAQKGETLTTLDQKEISLNQDMLVICDDRGPLALAGIKGGKRAQVTEETKNIIIESAHFNPDSIRKTSTFLALRTEASKRFENDFTAGLSPIALDWVTEKIVADNPDALVGTLHDHYPHTEQATKIQIDSKMITDVLGVSISEKEIEAILKKLYIKTEKTSSGFVLSIPDFRKDLTIPEDIVEEVGRLYGYEKIPEAHLPKTKKPETISADYVYEQKIRHTLLGMGFSEVYTPTLVQKGDIEIANPLASDKRALRTSLTEGLTKASEQAVYNAPLLGLQTIKIFEIGTTFPNKKETTTLGILVHDIPSKGKKNKALEDDAIKSLTDLFGVDVSTEIQKEGNVIHIPLSNLIPRLPKPSSYEKEILSPAISYKIISQYPFTARDIAVFTPDSTSQDDLEQLIIKQAGPLLVRHSLFDVFKKDDKTSYAFRLVFQSPDRTLTDEEVNSIMNTMTTAITQKGWHVR